MLESFRSALLVLSMAGVALLNSAATTPAPVAPPGAPHKSVAPHARPALANTHLHGAKLAVESAIAKTRVAKKTLARHWLARWDFATWATVHRGTGTIEGKIVNASGSPMSGSKVFLRTSKGKALRTASAKHITHSGAGGLFIMRHVRIGSYRVRGELAKASGRTPVHVHGGVTNMVTVKL
jgi:hypothetical protein